jgi:hypothetical protein
MQGEVVNTDLADDLAPDLDQLSVEILLVPSCERRAIV